MGKVIYALPEAHTFDLKEPSRERVNYKRVLTRCRFCFLSGQAFTLSPGVGHPLLSLLPLVHLSFEHEVPMGCSPPSSNMHASGCFHASWHLHTDFSLHSTLVTCCSTEWFQATVTNSSSRFPEQQQQGIPGPLPAVRHVLQQRLWVLAPAQHAHIATSTGSADLESTLQPGAPSMSGHLLLPGLWAFLAPWRDRPVLSPCSVGSMAPSPLTLLFLRHVLAPQACYLYFSCLAPTGSSSMREEVFVYCLFFAQCWDGLFCH